MAFKMTPGIKGNPAAKRVASLGACGGPGQPPCEPRFQKEVTEARVQDRKSSRFVKAKAKAAVVAPPPPKPPKLQINLPKGYEFKDKLAEKMFYSTFEQAIEKGKYKTQEELDMAINQQLKGGGPKDPKDPKDPGGPIFDNPGGPIMEDPKAPGKFEPIPIKGGESEAGLSKPKAKSVAAK